WLRADLAAWAKQVASGGPRERTLRVGVLTAWTENRDLDSARDDKALERLPKEEREGWQKLWAEGKDVLKSDSEAKGTAAPSEGNLSQDALGRGHPAAARVDLHSGAQGPGRPLEDGLHDVVGVAAVVQQDVQVEQPGR